MKTLILATVCTLIFSTTFVTAQSSQGKGGAAVTGETADPAKGIGAPGASSTTNVAPETKGETATSPNPTNPATGVPVPNAAISQPPANAAAPAGR